RDGHGGRRSAPGGGEVRAGQGDGEGHHCGDDRGEATAARGRSGYVHALSFHEGAGRPAAAARTLAAHSCPPHRHAVRPASRPEQNGTRPSVAPPPASRHPESWSHPPTPSRHV